MENLQIRHEILGAGLRFWQVAEALGISSSTLSVRLRKPLSDEEQLKIREVIKTLAGGETHDLS